MRPVRARDVLARHRGRLCADSASRGAAVPSRHRRDSPSSDEAVGGLISDFERVSGEIATRHVSHTGSIDRNEMRDLMRKFSPEATIDEIEAVCDALDSDGGGDISFEEFFDFTQKLTFHMARDAAPSLKMATPRMEGHCRLSKCPWERSGRVQGSDPARVVGRQSWRCALEMWLCRLEPVLFLLSLVWSLSLYCVVLSLCCCCCCCCCSWCCCCGCGCCCHCCCC